MSIRLALLGHRIAHSKSPQIYRRLLGAAVRYDLLDIAHRQDIPSWQTLAQTYQGINITAPWKEVFASFAEPRVAHLGAVNCLRLQADSCEATNTDWSALRILLPQMLKRYGVPNECVLLGSGVMARITADVCAQLSIGVRQYARSLGDNLEQLMLGNQSASSQKSLLINACGRSFSFKGNLSGAWVFWDFNYAHDYHETHIPADHVTYVDGRELLELQAQHAIQFWNRTVPH